jgi:hypothetical protein
MSTLPSDENLKESQEIFLRWIRRAYGALANLPREHKSPLAREVRELLEEATPWVK